ncbi:DHHA1 domain protein [uncultured archaeon]|nr:DHHA1 domain protein [uncultured archaeon]
MQQANATGLNASGGNENGQGAPGKNAAAANCLESFDSFARDIPGRGKIAIVHDLDADGICSGAIVYNAILLLRGRKPDLVITQQNKSRELVPKTLSMLKKKGISKLIVVDFAIDQEPASLAKAEKIVKQVLVIDHHRDYGCSGWQKTVFVKPQFFSEIEPSRYPASKLAYDLFSRHVNMEKFSWIASVGLMGDSQLEQWKDFVQASEKRHGTAIHSLSKCVDIISSVETISPKNLNSLLIFIAKADSPNKLVRSKFSSYTLKMDKLLRRLLAEFEIAKEELLGNELVWFEFRSKENIKSALINKVSGGMMPNRTVIVVQDNGDGFLHFSARRQDFKVKVNELLEKAVKGLKEAGAGGHVPAAAGKILKKDLPEFRKRVLELLQKNDFSY